MKRFFLGLGLFFALAAGCLGGAGVSPADLANMGGAPGGQLPGLGGPAPGAPGQLPGLGGPGLPGLGGPKK